MSLPAAHSGLNGWPSEFEPRVYLLFACKRGARPDVPCSRSSHPEVARSRTQVSWAYSIEKWEIPRHPIWCWHLRWQAAGWIASHREPRAQCEDSLYLYLDLATRFTYGGKMVPHYFSEVDWIMKGQGCQVEEVRRPLTHLLHEAMSSVFPVL